MGTDIFERDLSGHPVSTHEAGFGAIKEVILQAQRILSRLNHSHLEKEQVTALFSQLTGREVDSSFWLLPPFYTDFGRNIFIGRNVFINHCCEFMDRGGIYLDDDVFIGPKVVLTTINHDLCHKHITTTKPIHICKGAWIGANVTVLPGITIGEQAVVCAGAVVTKDIPTWTVAAGVPAKVIKTIERP